MFLAKHMAANVIMVTAEMIICLSSPAVEPMDALRNSSLGTKPLAVSSRSRKGFMIAQNDAGRIYLVEVRKGRKL